MPTLSDNTDNNNNINININININNNRFSVTNLKRLVCIVNFISQHY